MIINYAAISVNKLKASLNDDAGVVIYDRRMFIVQATELDLSVSASLKNQISQNYYGGRGGRVQGGGRYVINNITVMVLRVLLRVKDNFKKFNQGVPAYGCGPPYLLGN
jgi:hypothetical protein